jgi:aspartate racemase
VIINALDGGEIWAFRQSKDQEAEGQFFAEQALRLERAGADYLLIASNTSHKNVPWIEGAVSIPLIHLAKATAQAAQEAGHVRVALLGTSTTLEGTFCSGVLRDSGLEVVIPNDEDRAYMSDAIYNRLVNGIVGRADISRFADIATGLIQSYEAQSVVLGCTELTLLGLPEEAQHPLS